VSPTFIREMRVLCLFLFHRQKMNLCTRKLPLFVFFVLSFFKDMLSFFFSKLFKLFDIFTLCKLLDGSKSFSFFSTKSSSEPFPTFISMDDCDSTTEIGLAEEYPTTIS